jgi:hypothetical protein
MASDGKTIAISSIGNSLNGKESGLVRVYKWSGSEWKQLGNSILGKEANDNSGWSISLSNNGEILAIGSPWGKNNGNMSGHVRIYKWSGSNWTQLGTDIAGDAVSDQSGWSVSISGNGEIVAIGAINNDGSSANSGNVKVYKWTGIAWTQLGANINGQANGDASGWSISLSENGSIIAIGAPRYDRITANMVGQVRVYNWSGTEWTQLGSDIIGEATDDNSGASVSISSDGSILAIGAPNNSGNGNQSGHVRIYKWSGTVWKQLGADIDGEDAGDFCGWSVAISGNGEIAAIGAPRNGGNGSRSGHVRVYSLINLLDLRLTRSEKYYYIYPNPTNDHIFLNITNEIIGSEFKIYNMLGNEIKIGTLLSTNTFVNLNDFCHQVHIL